MQRLSAATQPPFKATRAIEHLDRLLPPGQGSKRRLDILVASARLRCLARSMPRAINVRGLLNACHKALPLMTNAGSINIGQLYPRVHELPRLHHLQRDQGCGPLLRANLDGRAEGPGHGYCSERPQ